MKSYFLFWKRAFDISGVTSRTQYWTTMLVNVIVVTVLMIELSALETAMYERHQWDSAHLIEDISPILIGIYGLVLIIPTITLTIRRLHDHNNSGLLYLINFIPAIGSIIIFIFMCLGTVKHDNQWRMNDIKRGLLPEDKENPLGDWQYEDLIYHMEYEEKNREGDI